VSATARLHSIAAENIDPSRKPRGTFDQPPVTSTWAARPAYPTDPRARVGSACKDLRNELNKSEGERTSSRSRNYRSGHL